MFSCPSVHLRAATVTDVTHWRCSTGTFEMKVREFLLTYIFTGKKTEARGVEVSCLESHKWILLYLNLNPTKNLSSFQGLFSTWRKVEKVEG